MESLRYTLEQAQAEAEQLKFWHEAGCTYSEAEDCMIRMNEIENQSEKWEPEDGYKWVLTHDGWVPANENWQPLDLSPCPSDEVPWPGDFCYVSQHPDSKNYPDTARQLAFVYYVDEHEGYAGIMLVTDNLDVASKVSVTLKPEETRIPFDVVVEAFYTCGTVSFDQLSRPVGYSEQPIINALGDVTITGKLNFPEDKLGPSLSGPEDPRWIYQIERAQTALSLGHNCLSKILSEDSAANDPGNGFCDEEEIDPTIYDLTSDDTVDQKGWDTGV